LTLEVTVKVADDFETSNVVGVASIFGSSLFSHDESKNRAATNSVTNK
jgi:hypothetical protein